MDCHRNCVVGLVSCCVCPIYPKLPRSVLSYAIRRIESKRGIVADLVVEIPLGVINAKIAPIFGNIRPSKIAKNIMNGLIVSPLKIIRFLGIFNLGRLGFNFLATKITTVESRPGDQGQRDD